MRYSAALRKVVVPIQDIISQYDADKAANLAQAIRNYMQKSNTPPPPPPVYPGVQLQYTSSSQGSNTLLQGAYNFTSNWCNYDYHIGWLTDQYFAVAPGAANWATVSWTNVPSSYLQPPPIYIDPTTCYSTTSSCPSNKWIQSINTFAPRYQSTCDSTKGCASVELFGNGITCCSLMF